METGEVYACDGSERSRDWDPVPFWHRDPVSGPVLALVTSDSHSFLLLETGEVYARGYNGLGQLGLGDTRSRNSWQRVAVPGVVRTIVASAYHSFLHLETGEVYACGDNDYGQLGLGDYQSRSQW
jgi:alpha-tubulin suppressor-like RCC1 family protein